MRSFRTMNAAQIEHAVLEDLRFVGPGAMPIADDNGQPLEAEDYRAILAVARDLERRGLLRIAPASVAVDRPEVFRLFLAPEGAQQAQRNEIDRDQWDRMIRGELDDEETDDDEEDVGPPPHLRTVSRGSSPAAREPSGEHTPNADPEAHWPAGQYYEGTTIRELERNLLEDALNAGGGLTYAPHRGPHEQPEFMPKVVAAAGILAQRGHLTVTPGFMGGGQGAMHLALTPAGRDAAEAIRADTERVRQAARDASDPHAQPPSVVDLSAHRALLTRLWHPGEDVNNNGPDPSVIFADAPDRFAEISSVARALASAGLVTIDGAIPVPHAATQEGLRLRLTAAGRAIARRYLGDPLGADQQLALSLADAPKPSSEVSASEREQSDAPQPAIAIVWNPAVVTAEEYAELVEILGNLARLEGAKGVTRIKHHGLEVTADETVAL